MSDFFKARLDGYDEHMLTGIEGAAEFYALTKEDKSVYTGKVKIDLPSCGYMALL